MRLCGQSVAPQALVACRHWCQFVQLPARAVARERLQVGVIVLLTLSLRAPSGFSSNLQNPVVFPTQNTTYSVTITSGIKTTTASTSVAVNVLPTANAGADATVVIGNSTILTASGGNSYLWSNAATTASTTVSPQTTTIYIVTVTNQNGCSKTDTVQVNVPRRPAF